MTILDTVSSGANQALRLGKDLGLGGPGTQAANWFQQLRPASYRGLGFGVLTGDGKFGRRNAVHEYPYRDTPWVEDLGRSARRIIMQGFIVGDDVISQRDRMIAAVESPESAELVHPTFGRLKVALIDFGCHERWDNGRYFELNFSFIEAGERVFPAATSSTSDAVKNAADGADAAASQDFATRAYAALKKGAIAARQAATMANMLVRKIQRVVNDATNLYNTVGSLPGQFGRFFGSRRQSKAAKAQTGITNAVGVAAGVAVLIAAGSASRVNVSSAGAALNTSAANLP